MKYVAMMKDEGNKVDRSASVWKPLKKLGEAERNLFQLPFNGQSIEKVSWGVKKISLRNIITKIFETYEENVICLKLRETEDQTVI